MSKAFTKEDNGADTDEDFDEPQDVLPPDTKNYMTPDGAAALRAELRYLLREERPAVCEIVSWAAGNGDRSENGDYLYNKKRLREIDRRVRYLNKRLDNCEVVDPRRQQGLEKVFFGATVTYAHEDGSERTVKLVGVDEADLEAGKINWLTPVAKALMKRGIGDNVTIQTPAGPAVIEIVAIDYIVTDSDA